MRYAEAILDAGGGGRVVPGPEALGDSTNAAQRQNRPVPKGWGGIGGIAALRRREEPARAVRRRRALHYPQWRSHITHRIYLLEYLALLFLLSPCLMHGEDKVPLQTELPNPLFAGTPVPIKVANLERPREGKRPAFNVPEGTINLSLGKAVTSSDNWPVIGEIEFVCDGDKDGEEGYYVELGPKLQYVQIDLQEPAVIHAILVWHYHGEARVYHDIIVQISNDREFVTGVQTVYNNDHDNSAGFGIGKDKAYVETYEGRLIDATGTVGRYVRLYSNGNTRNSMNHYTEVEVFGQPAT